ncbi:M20/M25/M40 family metallo-hydrolase [Salinimicrobium oceani]|uniref:M20/M25/M40 family metallo-hydrolase n=1 Tax=Salinimicrobium oceani TaxID=2722702 RepID=A0ABX1D2M1_9FLAO|nr:M20/M25/M40 family metallo-hydrolase [Salinimicrobium oceani]NJW53909.1 M20/M25/M40 family metallo-hydrolase [Salinimicrobium oceani]
MKKTFSWLLALSFLLHLGCGQSKDVSNEAVVPSENKLTPENSILEEEVAASLKYLSSDELQGRETGTAGIELAAQYIEQVFETHAVKPFFETYRDSFEVKEVTGYNIVGVVEGTDPDLKDEFIIIGAHYDHVGQAKVVEGDSLANGANDNASGTTAVLELAKYFAARAPKRSILFTLFSAEEMGLVGAKELAGRLKAQGIDLYAMFNIEMIGVPMTGRDYQAYITGYEISNMAEKFNEYSQAQVLGFLPEAKQYSLFQRSDNYSFYQEFNVPAQTISTFDFQNYPYYHHVDDEFEFMDVNHMEELIENLIPGLTAMANTAEKEIKLN